MQRDPSKLVLWMRIATFLLSVVAVFYGVAWFFMGMVFALTGTLGGIAFYVLVFAFAATPMVAYWLAGCIRYGELPVRKAALWGLVVMAPAGVIIISLLRNFARDSNSAQNVDLLTIAFFAVPGVIAVFLIVAFALLALRRPNLNVK